MVRITLGEKLMQRMPDGCGFSAENLHLLIVVVCEFLSDYTINGCASRHYNAQTYYIASQAQACVNEILASWLSKLPFEHIDGYSSREVVAQALSWAIFGPATRWLQNGHKTTPQELAACIVPFALSALQPVLAAVN
ncbi:MAG: hypothetical protein D6712_15555 [Chloroflexi bacterium]|nr:MAG: hypothetical protein D6712_15555 [Chloroflexota bacterium]